MSLQIPATIESHGTPWSRTVVNESDANRIALSPDHNFSDCSYCATAMSAGLSLRRDLSLSVATVADKPAVPPRGGALLDRFATIRVALKHAESRSLVVEGTRVRAVGFGVCAVKEEDRIFFTVVRPGKCPANPAGFLIVVRWSQNTFLLAADGSVPCPAKCEKRLSTYLVWPWLRCARAARDS